MNYRHIVKGRFLERPNRFIAYVEIEGRQETVHVKNTGRCRELLVPGATVYLEESENPQRKTRYDLVAVEKGSLLINMDSQAPNQAAYEWLLKKELFADTRVIQPETKYGSSRFDFYIETQTEKIFMEVKGVTLEENGEVRFPDAPSERAVKHIEELIRARKNGYRACVLFVIQMERADFFCPNEETHPAFAGALREAAAQGVEIYAYCCRVTEDSMNIDRPVPVLLTAEEKTTFCKNLISLKRKFRFGELSEIPNPLLTWYDKNRRILPWREDPKPYKVWVSEIMLQQTRVEAVKPYFERFMEVLPDVQQLAAAREDTLLKLWEGLGYYNRVRNLQKAAIQIMEDYGGQMPDTYEELLKLKGIGSYTAGAIASIAFRRPVPAVDGNVLRVISRIRRDERLITDTRVRKAVEADLFSVIPGDRPGDFNQAMMEIGATVCIPNGAPYCEKCPLSHICMAHRDGCELEYPRKAAPKKRQIEEKTILIIRDGNRAALKKRSEKGLLAGMYEFPSLEGFRTAEEVTQYLAGQGIRAIRITPLPAAKHIFTHKEWHMIGFMVRVDELAPKQLTEVTSKWIFTEPQTTQEEYPVPAAFAAYTRYLNIKLGNEKFEK